MEEFIGQINTMWGVVALSIFLVYKIVDYSIKNTSKRKSDYVLTSNFKELKEAFEDHTRSETEFKRDVTSQIKRLELMQVMSMYPTKTTRIESLYSSYKDLGGNSYIDDVYDDWRGRSSVKRTKKAKKDE